MIRDIPHHSNKGAQTTHKKELTYERNLTDRSSWWKDTIKHTPSPGSYHIRDFIEEARLNPVGKTYGFKDTGRNSKNWYMKSGAMLLPGAYSFIDCTQKALQYQASYPFKSCPRPENYTLGVRDKDIDLSPCHYDVTEKPVPKLPCKHVMFRSAVQRLIFLPKEGPAPGHYTLNPCRAKAITSCFRSTAPRLYSMCSRTPGPGAYEPSWQISPCFATKNNMCDIHGLL
ncbi:protein STPG4 [Clarias gariepinus]|uniref:protein STPG4 n=1 Tax=Clarias gariepinus TaxID=13013 RepID=UPI00234C8062|nr:protein STPG4 [Clarias gariepinus]